MVLQNDLLEMSSFLQYIYPSDPNAIYKLASVCAIWGSVGVLVASFLREWLNIYIMGSFDHSKCSDEMITKLDENCLTYMLGRRASSAFWNQTSHMIIMFFGLITCLPFFAMEDIYSGYEGASVMRDALLLGTVMEIMDSAFKVGIRTSSGIISTIFKTNTQKGIHPSPVFYMGASILSSSITWVTFLRDAILAIGVFLATVYDKEVQAIGGSWQMTGWITSVIGLVNSIMELGKVMNFGFFNEKSNFTYYVFQLAFTAWMVLFGMHCKSQVTGEEKGMLDGDGSSGSDVSDGEEAPAPVRVEESEEEEEEEKEEKPKKHRRHHKRRHDTESDDDV